MTISCHQPNLCPYAGFFEKMEQSDVFVILNHVQFPKNNYVNRFNYADKWYTMRINQSLIPIIKKEYLHPEKDWLKITQALPKLEVFNDCVNANLAQMNSQIIRKAAELLNIETLICYDYDSGFTGTERLVNICQLIGADTYLSGTSGEKYLDLELFKKSGIKVIFQQNPDKRALVELL